MPATYALTQMAMPGCCGIRVITGWPYETVSDLETKFKAIFELNNNNNFILIASLVDKQRTAGAEDVLRKFGFRQVSSSLKNPNSQNQLWVFLYDKKTLKEVKKSVFKKRAA